ncbi:hypothetical protein EVC12_182 [Rhizobium phage RHph_I42]|nr:hypothetical protein EVC12_182 [Rhizobium phage RHph_I42]
MAKEVAKSEYLINASDGYETSVETVSTRAEVREKIAYYKRNGWRFEIYRARLMTEQDFLLPKRGRNEVP